MLPADVELDVASVVLLVVLVSYPYARVKKVKNKSDIRKRVEIIRMFLFLRKLLYE